MTYQGINLFSIRQFISFLFTLILPVSFHLEILYFLETATTSGNFLARMFFFLSSTIYTKLDAITLEQIGFLLSI